MSGSPFKSGQVKQFTVGIIKEVDAGEEYLSLNSDTKLVSSDGLQSSFKSSRNILKGCRNLLKG